MPRAAIVRSFAFLLLLTVLTATTAGARPKPATAPEPAVSEALLGSLEWREVGPYRGGRSAAVAGIPSQPQVYYFGSTGGGVWKTTDGGTSWENVSDGFFGGSIGAVAVSEWDPNVIYVGGGEKTVRGNVSHGDGVWKSTDAGATWRHVGLSDTRHVPRIRIHPRDPDTVWVAALGHLFGPNDERGVFRSRDGGETWEQVLDTDRDAGAVDLALDPTNPRILYATTWRVRRTPWSLESGGEGSGLYKSTDGGTTWSELSGNPGLPEPPLGISGITVSPSDPQNLYAIVEAAEGGVFRSRDGGETWERTNSERKLRQRAWYYTRIVADPADAETVYVLNVRFHRSKDGGRTFSRVGTPHGDNHDLWIDPGDPRRMIESNDGGANVSFDGGETWSPQDNQPTAQMYRVSTDDDFPYRLLGGQQDNSAVRIRSRSAFGRAIGQRDWEPTAGGESGHIVARPGEPDVVFGGSYGGYLIRLDHRTGEERAVNVWPDDPMGWAAGDLRYRFQWNYPLLFSPHDPDRLFAAANVLFESRDHGASWRAISPDLTRADPDTLGASGGPITKDNTSVEYYATIFAVAESLHEPGVLWTGSDDGLIHLSRDDGETWSDVTPPEMPGQTMINSLEAHPTEPGGLYVAATRYKLDDFAPCLYATTDYGATWRTITHGIEENHFTRAIRADPERPGLLYAGTERGVYFSLDDGIRWQPLGSSSDPSEGGLPIVPVTDLAVKGGDLVAATQGRGYWILDDLEVLRTLDPAVADSALHLVPPRPVYRLGNGRADDPGNRGTNPPAGAVFHFWLGEEPASEAEALLEILGPDGERIRHFTRKPADGEEKEKDDDESDVREDPRQVELAQGMNRFVWDLRHAGAESFPGMVLWNDRLDGPLAVPGTYRARLTVGEETVEEAFEVLADPRSSATAEDRQAQLDFLLALRDTLTDTHRAIVRLRAARNQLKALRERLADEESPVHQAAKALEDKLDAVEKALYQTESQSPQDPLNFPIRLNDKLAGLYGLAAVGDFRPTASMLEVKAELGAAISAQLETLEAALGDDLAEIERLAREHGVPAVRVETPRE